MRWAPAAASGRLCGVIGTCGVSEPFERGTREQRDGTRRAAIVRAALGEANQPQGHAGPIGEPGGEGAGDEAAFRTDFRFAQLVDHADLFWALTRSRAFLRRWLAAPRWAATRQRCCSAFTGPTNASWWIQLSGLLR